MRLCNVHEWTVTTWSTSSIFDFVGWHGWLPSTSHCHIIAESDRRKWVYRIHTPCPFIGFDNAHHPSIPTSMIFNTKIIVCVCVCVCGQTTETMRQSITLSNGSNVCIRRSHEMSFHFLQRWKNYSPAPSPAVALKVVHMCHRHNILTHSLLAFEKTIARHSYPFACRKPQKPRKWKMNIRKIMP